MFLLKFKSSSLVWAVYVQCAVCSAQSMEASVKQLCCGSCKRNCSTLEVLVVNQKDKLEHSNFLSRYYSQKFIIAV